MLQLKDIRNVGKYHFNPPLTREMSGGEVVCITGSWGSDLLKAILTQQPAEGYISIDSERITPRTIHILGKNMGYLPYDLPDADITVRDLLTMFFDASGNDEEFSFKQLMEEWQQLAIGKNVYELALGEVDSAVLRRVCLSFLCMVKRHVCLLDRPTEDFADAEAACVARKVRQLADEGRVVAIATTDERLIDVANVVLK